jgi:L-asparaginase
MLELHHVAQSALDRGAHGVVIAHGTDTLEESAFFLDMLHRGDQPIVFVGAMRTKDELSWDGPVNLFGACTVAGEPRARGRGVLVSMNNTIHAASEVTKTYTEAIDTFVTPDCGSLGMIELGRVFFHRMPLRRVSCDVPAHLPRVDLIEAAAGSDGTILRAAAASGSNGLVVAAMGRGNLPPLMARALADVVATGVPVVVTSRCWGGRVAPVYGYEGGGARLLESGAIFSPWLGAAKARIALCLGLAAGLDTPRLKRLFDSP